VPDIIDGLLATLAALNPVLLYLLTAPSWPERNRRSPCAASSLATAPPTSPPAPTMTAVLSSRRRGLVAAIIHDTGPPFLGSLTREAAATVRGSASSRGLGWRSGGLGLPSGAGSGARQPDEAR
jgi:hypothetical protein